MIIDSNSFFRYTRCGIHLKNIENAKFLKQIKQAMLVRPRKTPGGEKVAKEIVELVRQAEADADKKEKDAKLQKEAIINEAQAKAKAYITSMTNDAIKKAEQQIAMAHTQGEQLTQEFMQKAELEKQEIKENIRGNEKEVIQMILTKVLS